MPTKRANTKAARKREEKQSRAGEFDEFNGLDENGIEARSDDDEDDQGSDLDGFIVGEEEDDEEVHTPAAATPATRLGIDPSLIIEGKRNRRAPVRYWDEIKDTVQELFQEEETETDEEEIIPVDPATITTALPEEAVVNPEEEDEDTEEEEEEAEEDVSEYEESEEEEDPEDDSEDMESEEEDPEEPAPKRRRVNPQPQQQPRSAGVNLTPIATAPEIASPQENQQDVLVHDTPVAAESHCRDESSTQESRGTSL